MRATRMFLGSLLLGLTFFSATLLRAADEPQHSAVKPVPREQAAQMARHEKINERAKQGNIDLIFLGDSITQGWEGSGKDVWDKHYASRKSANMGIGGDRTQHVLWRLDNGNIDGLSPKLVVLMIGTNNSNREDNTAEEIADGIKAIVKKLRDKLPQSKILLLAVFPRGDKLDPQGLPNPQRAKNARASELASQAADGTMVHFLDVGPKFLEADGALSREIMPDLLHLSPKGYSIWAEAIEPKVKELLGG